MPLKNKSSMPICLNGCLFFFFFPKLGLGNKMKLLETKLVWLLLGAADELD